MKDLEREIKGYNALQLTCEYNRLLSLAEEDDLRLIKLSDAKRLVYIEEELQSRRDKLLPGMPKAAPSQIEEPENANHMNVILKSYYKRKSKPKVESEKLFRFFVKVKNNLNSTIASIPVMALNKDEALLIAEKKSKKFRNKKLTFEVS